jgi:hypothetical protein
MQCSVRAHTGPRAYPNEAMCRASCTLQHPRPRAIGSLYVGILLHFSATRPSPLLLPKRSAPKPNLSQSASFVISISFAFQQMSSPPQSPARASCPFQLSENSIASFSLELPPLDESRLSPTLAASSAQVRKRFMSAASDAQSLMHSMREAWMQWHLLPVIPQGELLVSVLL